MKKILYMLCCISLTFGCKKYLDTLPDNRIVITTPEQVTKLLVNAYPKKNYAPFTEAMSDNFEDKGSSGLNADPSGFKINSDAFRFLDVESVDDDSPHAYFYACYKAISVANQALTYCNNADSARYRGQKGEALVARAYAHFMLVTLFSKVYDPATASTDPGIPYVTTVEDHVFARYDRKTVQYVYEMIEKDLILGLPLIDETSYGDAPKYHFNLKAANAFASRFYLFKKEYAKVINHSNKVLGENAQFLIRSRKNYSRLQYETQAVLYTKSSENANLLLQESSSNWYQNRVAFYRYGLFNNIKEKFSAAPGGGTYALNMYGGQPQLYNVPKFHSYSNGTGISIIMPLFCTDEVLFNRIEAALEIGGEENYSNAYNDIIAWTKENIIYENQATFNEYEMVKYYANEADKIPDIPSQMPLMLVRSKLPELCADFKRLSNLQEGIRWFDIIRLKTTVTHTTSGQTITIEPDDKRRVLQLPQEAKTAGMELNPR